MDGMLQAMMIPIKDKPIRILARVFFFIPVPPWISLLEPAYKLITSTVTLDYIIPTVENCAFLLVKKSAIFNRPGYKHVL